MSRRDCGTILNLSSQIQDFDIPRITIEAIALLSGEFLDNAKPFKLFETGSYVVKERPVLLFDRYLQPLQKNTG